MSAWLATMRIARRDAQRAKGRTALVAVMIGLPVLLVSAVDVIARSSQDGPEQVVSRQLGASAQALVTAAYPGTPVVQLPDQRWGQPLDSETVTPPPAADPADIVDQVSELLPAGNRLVQDVQGYGARFRISSADGDRILTTDLRESDWADPGVAGRLTVQQGRLPSAAGEVAITPSLARHGNLAIGDEIEHVDASGITTDVSVVGIAEESSGSGHRSVLAVPGALLPDAAIQDGMAEVTYLVVGPDPVRWQDVLVLNELGLAVLSRAVVLDPPPDSDVPYLTAGLDGGGEGDVVVIAAAATAVGLALLEVALLAGPAFAVGARRNRRQLALVAASGGERRHVRNIVLAGGLVIGLGASVVGAALGAALGVGLLPVLEHYELGDFAHTDIRPLDLLAVVAVGTLTAVAAAVVPAWQAGNQDVVAALAGRRGQAPARRRVAVAGVVVVAAGTAMALFGAAQRQPYLLVGGTALAELGLIAATGALIVLVARGARRLPMAPRLALRDAARQRGRTAPAVAAVMAAVAGSVAISLVVAATDERDRQGHQPVAAHGRVVQDLSIMNVDGTTTDGDLPASERVLRAQLPIDQTAVLRGPASIGDTGYYVSATMPPEAECPLWVMATQPSQEQIDAARDDPRCEVDDGYTTLAQLGGSGLIVDDGPGLALALGDDNPAVERALATGHVVVYDPNLVWDDGTAHLTIEEQPGMEVNGPMETEPPRTLVLPAIVASSSLPPAGVVMSPETAQEAGLATSPQYLVATTTAMPTDDEVEQARASLEDAGQNGNVQVERGYVSDYGIGLLALAVAAAVVTLGATGIAVGLAAADGRADLATLAAVGASPGLRRRLAASQAGVVSVLGVGLGVIAGLVPGAALVWMMGGGGFGNAPGSGFAQGWQYAVMPWPNLVVIGVVVPVLAVGCGYLFTRSRLPMVRRVGL